MSRKNLIKLFFITLFFILLSYCYAVLFHEYGHGLTAWLFGYKSSPFNIIYGIQANKGWLLDRVNENVNYDAIYMSGQHLRIALIGVSGILTNIVLAVIFIMLLKISFIQKNIWTFSFCFWGLILNWMSFFGYVFYLGINSQGDIGYINHGLGISFWWVYCIGLMIGLCGIYIIFRYEIIKAYAFHLPKSLIAYRTYFIVTLITFFYIMYIRSILLYLFFGEPFINHGFKIPSGTLALAATVIVIIVFFVFDPKRQWIKRAIQHMRLKK